MAKGIERRLQAIRSGACRTADYPWTTSSANTAGAADSACSTYPAGIAGAVGFDLSLSLFLSMARSLQELSFDASLIVLASFVRLLEPVQLFPLFGYVELEPGFDPSTFVTEGQNGASEPRRQMLSRDLFLFMDSANRVALCDVESMGPSSWINYE